MTQTVAALASGASNILLIILWVSALASVGVAVALWASR